MSTENESTTPPTTPQKSLELLRAEANTAEQSAAGARERLAAREAELAEEATAEKKAGDLEFKSAGIKGLGVDPATLGGPRPLPPESPDEPQWMKDKRFKQRAMAALNRRPDPFAADAIAPTVPPAPVKPTTPAAKRSEPAPSKALTNEEHRDAAIAALGGFRPRFRDGDGKLVNRAAATPRRFVNEF